MNHPARIIWAGSLSICALSSSATDIVWLCNSFFLPADEALSRKLSNFNSSSDGYSGTGSMESARAMRFTTSCSAIAGSSASTRVKASPTPAFTRIASNVKQFDVFMDSQRLSLRFSYQIRSGFGRCPSGRAARVLRGHDSAESGTKAHHEEGRYVLLHEHH